MGSHDLPSRLVGVRFPDSELAAAAKTFVAEASPEFLVNHSLRVFTFGSLLCERRGLQVDAELGFVAALMHDLGLTDSHASADHRFEVDGADVAHRFLTERQVDAQRSDLVWDAIALHTTFGIAERKAPEIALVHYGINMDVGGVGADLLTRNEIDQVVARYPRLRFQDRFRQLVTDHVNRRPACHLFTWAGWIAREGEWNPDASSGQLLHSTIWTE